MQIAAEAAAARFAVLAEHLLQFSEQVRIGPEVTEPVIAGLQRQPQSLLHLGAVVAVQAVALDEGRLDTLASEDLLERTHDRGGARSRGAGDGNDGIPGGHGCAASVRVSRSVMGAW